MNKEKRSTNISYYRIIEPGRRFGNSTRQIDKAIQDLFNGHIVIVEDHHEQGHSRMSNVDLFRRILNRLQFEHNLDQLIKNKKIRIDKKKLELELI